MAQGGEAPSAPQGSGAPTSPRARPDPPGPMAEAVPKHLVVGDGLWVRALCGIRGTEGDRGCEVGPVSHLELGSALRDPVVS